MSMVTVRPQPGACSVASGTLVGGSDVGSILSGGSGPTAHVTGCTTGGGLGTQTNFVVTFQTAPIPVGSQIYQYALRVRHDWKTVLLNNNPLPPFNYAAPAQTTIEQPSIFYLPYLFFRFLSFASLPGAGSYNALIGNWLEKGSQSMAQQDIITVHNPTDLDISITIATFIVSPDQITTNNLYEVFLDVYYDAPPTVAISAPVGVVANATPAITFTPTDPEGGGIDAYQIRVYSDSAYTGSLFDPSTSNNYEWDSGRVAVGLTSGLPFTTYVGGNGLQNNRNYRMFIRAADVSSGGRLGQWSQIDFSTSFATPGTPGNVSVLPDNTNARYVIKFVGTGGAVSTDSFDIQRSDDGGTTWGFIRNGQQSSVAGVASRFYSPTPATIQCATTFGVPRITYNGTADVKAVMQTIRAKTTVNSPVAPVETLAVDIESVPLVPAQYRVRAIHQYVAGFSYSTSAWVTVTPTQMISPQWRLKDPLTGSNISVEVIPPFSFNRREGVSVYDGVGRTTSFYMSDGVKGDEGNVKFRTRTQAAYNALLAMLDTGNILILEDWTYGRRWYAKFEDGGNIVTVTSAPDGGSATLLRHLHEQAYSFREMAAP